VAEKEGRKTIESYEKTDIQEQKHLLELDYSETSDKWWVTCWLWSEADSDWEHQWEVAGVVTGYKDDNPMLEIRTPFTEETARREFEKWRK
jgi:hypothetical protein